MNLILYVSSALKTVIPDRLLIGDGDHVISSADAVKYLEAKSGDDECCCCCCCWSMGGSNAIPDDMSTEEKKRRRF